MKKIILMFALLFLFLSIPLMAARPDYRPPSHQNYQWPQNIAAGVIDTNWCTNPINIADWDVNRIRVFMYWVNYECDSASVYQVCTSMKPTTQYIPTSYGDTVYSKAGSKDYTGGQYTLVIPRDSLMKYVRLRHIQESHADDSAKTNSLDYMWEGWKSKD